MNIARANKDLILSCANSWCSVGKSARKLIQHKRDLAIEARCEKPANVCLANKYITIDINNFGFHNYCEPMSESNNNIVLPHHDSSYFYGSSCSLDWQKYVASYAKGLETYYTKQVRNPRRKTSNGSK